MWWWPPTEDVWQAIERPVKGNTLTWPEYEVHILVQLVCTSPEVVMKKEAKTEWKISHFLSWLRFGKREQLAGQNKTPGYATHRPSSADWVCQSGPYNLPHNCQSGWPSHMETLTYSLTSCSPLPLVICSLTNKPKFTQNVNTNSLCINFVEMIGSILYNTNHIKSICSKCDEAGTEQRTW